MMTKGPSDQRMRRERKRKRSTQPPRAHWLPIRIGGTALLAAVMLLPIAALLLPHTAKAEAGEVTLDIEREVAYGGHTTWLMRADGYPAFCAQPNMSVPGSGAYRQTSLAAPSGQNDLVRAILYFGAEGPGQGSISWPTFVGSSGQTEQQKIWAETHLLAAYAWTGSIDTALTGVDGSWQHRRTWFLQHIFGMDESGRVVNESAPLQQIRGKVAEVPADFHVYQLSTGPSTQVVLSWSWAVDVTLRKSSTDVELTAGNASYSLAGATYEVRRASDDALVATVTTDAAGVAQFTLAPNDRYYVIEVGAPAGFKQDSERHYFTTSGAITEVHTADNPARASLTLHKADSATGAEAQPGASLVGATYRLTDSNGNTHEATSSEDGTLSFTGLPLGPATVVEIDPPEGYLLDTTVHEFELGSGAVHEDIVLEPSDPLIETVRAFDISIVKYADTGSDDSGLQTPAAGVSFEIVSNTTGNVVGTIVTDADGNATTAGSWFGYGTTPEGIGGALPYDRAGYTVREVAETTPDGYRPAGPWTISPDQMTNGATLQYIVDNDLVESRVQIVKTDAETGMTVPLAGFTFELLDAEHNPVTQEAWYPNHVELTSFTTDDTGSVTLPEPLRPGTYYLRETAVAPPYLLAGEEVAFEIPASTETPPVTVVSFTDEQAMGRATVTKQCDDDGALLSGAEFDVVACTDIVSPDGTIRAVEGQVVDHVTTGEDGTATTRDLYLGSGSATYAFVETAAPEGHALDSTPREFTLTYEVPEVALVQGSIAASDAPTTVTLRKVIAGTDRALPDTVFELWQVSFDEEGQPFEVEGSRQRLETGDDGIITLAHLLPGSYRIQETSAPAGYLLDETVHAFTVDDQGLIEGAASFEIVAENDYTKVDFSKRDITNESEIPGATLTILDSEGNPVATWTSTEEDHRIDALPPGTYTLVEEMTPHTYDQTTAVEFTVEETGVIQRVVMYDEPIEISGELDKRQEIADPIAENTVENGDGLNRAPVRVSQDGSFSYSVDVRSTSSTWVDEFTVTDDLTQVHEGLAELVSITTPQALGDFDGRLNVWYRTNMTPTDFQDPSGANATLSSGYENPWLTHESTAARLGDDGRVLDYSGWHLWAADVDAASATTLSVADLNLAEGEQVIGLRLEYGRVEAGFTSREGLWERDDLKDAHDDVELVVTPHEGEEGTAPLVLNLRVTGDYAGEAVLTNGAGVDLYRNGGAINGDEPLEDHDGDEVQQLPKTEDEPAEPTQPTRPLAQTGNASLVPAMTTTAGVGAAAYLLLRKRFSGRFPWKR